MIDKNKTNIWYLLLPEKKKKKRIAISFFFLSPENYNFPFFLFPLSFFFLCKTCNIVYQSQLHAKKFFSYLLALGYINLFFFYFFFFVWIRHFLALLDAPRLISDRSAQPTKVAIMHHFVKIWFQMVPVQFRCWVWKWDIIQ